jgi:hypothetical protein
MDFTRTRGADWLAALGGLLLLISLFLPWYDVRGFGISGWESLSVIDLILALAALLAMAVPLVTAARDSPPVSIAVTIVACTIALLALLLVLIRVIWVPSDGLEAGRDWGLWVGVVGVLVTTVGTWSALRDDTGPSLRPSPEPQRQPVPPAQAAG